jgi:hypothetical protein
MNNSRKLKGYRDDGHDGEFKRRLNEAIRERETGFVPASVLCFKEILEIPELTPMEQLLTHNHLGLAYYHLGPDHYKKAIDTFCYVIQASKSDARYLGVKAEALRNLSRPEFGGYGEVTLAHCVIYSERARQIANSIKRKDLVWFTHGVITVRIADELVDGYTRRLFREEVWEWLTLARGEGKLERQVWLLGIMKDFVCLYPAALSVPLLKTAKWWAHRNKLALREEQITKVLNEAKKKKKG